ncbi:MAG TPA: hypothetical protein VIL25_01445, partial [Vicinamibacterales bacterium]
MQRRAYDPVAIGRLAAALQDQGRTPDATIRRELRRAGLRGDMTDPEWRAAYLACEREWRKIAFSPEDDTRAARPRHGATRLLTPAVLWAAYQSGETQHDIARRYRIGRDAVRKHSYRLGFRLRGSSKGEVLIIA